jgi:hypothetical protein
MMRRFTVVACFVLLVFASAVYAQDENTLFLGREN